jgi:hypothetical protein
MCNSEFPALAAGSGPFRMGYGSDAGRNSSIYCEYDGSGFSYSSYLSLFFGLRTFAAPAGYRAACYLFELKLLSMCSPLSTPHTPPSIETSGSSVSPIHVNRKTKLWCFQPMA